jgi:hypothetical protein
MMGGAGVKIACPTQNNLKITSPESTFPAISYNKFVKVSIYLYCLMIGRFL